MNFTQMITIHSKDPQAIVDLLKEWDANQAAADIMGYVGTRVLVDRNEPGYVVVIADFAQVDPDVPAAEEAARNDDRAETQEWARRMREVIDGEPEYRNFDEWYRTG